MNTIGISVISNRTHITLLAEDILYLSLSGRKTVIHVTGNRIYETYTPIDELAKNLGSAFLRVDRCYLVSAKAIHDVTKTIDLINGESLDYARRRKREIVEQVRIERQKIGQTLERNDAPTSREAYHRHYASFDHMSFAFTDIEMVFSEEHSPSGCGSMSARRSMAKHWRSPTTVRKSTQNSKSSVSQPFRDTAAVCSLTAGRSRRCRAVHRRTTGRNHRRSVDSCFRIIRKKLPAFMRLSQLCMQNVANAS